MNLSLPTSDEYSTCGSWIQSSPDELPSNGFYVASLLTDIDMHTWYKVSGSDGTSTVGIQRYAIYSQGSNNSNSAVSTSTDYISNDTSFSNVNWMMDYSDMWYRIAVKLETTATGGGYPWWRSTPSQPSYVDFTYSYTTSPAVKSVSNENIVLLSATATSSINTLTLENPLTTATTTNIVLTGITTPFLNVTSTISSDSTTTLSSISLSPSSSTTLTSVNASILPASGSITTTITTWLTSGTYAKAWTETGSGIQNVSHTIGSLAPGTYYNVLVDGAKLSHYLADANGQISFTYGGSYSTHTFSIAEATGIGGGGGPSSGGGTVPTTTTTTTTTSSTTTTSTPSAAAADILATCMSHFSSYIKPGVTNNADEVRKLQIFLRDDEKIAPLEVSGIYDQSTINAVISFQEKYASDILGPWVEQKGTGYVYITTKQKLNQLYCSYRHADLSLSYEQMLIKFNELKTILVFLQQKLATMRGR